MPRTSHTNEPHGRPGPEPIRFYGTSWVDRSRGYRLRRLALGGGALLLAALGLGLLWLGHASLQRAETAGWLRVLVLAAFALCSVIAFARAWNGYTRPADADAKAGGGDDSAFRSITAVGIVGLLLAYAARTAVEAPGEGLHRRAHEAAAQRHERRSTRRSGNPARRGGTAAP